MSEPEAKAEKRELEGAVASSEPVVKRARGDAPAAEGAEAAEPSAPAPSAEPASPTPVPGQLNPRNNPVVFFDISIADTPVGRVKMELFAHVVPKTAENFRQLCTGEYRDRQGKPLGFKGCVFFKVIRDFIIQSGDYVNNDGTGNHSIYGEAFEDENFDLKHEGPGFLSMQNTGPNTNGSQFFITCAKAAWMDGKHVVFGKVIDGMLTIRKVENVSVEGKEANRPRLQCAITECGEM